MKPRLSGETRQRVSDGLLLHDSFTLADVQAVADILVGKSSVTDVSRYDKNGEAGITIADLTFVIKILNDGGVITAPGSAPTASVDGIRGE